MQRINERLLPDRRHISELPREWLQAHRNLVASVRRLMYAAATTAVGPEALRRSAALTEQAAQAVERDLGPGVLLGEFASPEKTDTARSRRIGMHNPSCLPLEITVDGATATATLTADALSEGPRDYLHGGLGAWLMDCMLGLLVESMGRQCVTARLELEYLAPTPLYRSLSLGAAVDSVSGRKIWANSWIECGGIRTVEAKGLFIEPRSLSTTPGTV